MKAGIADADTATEADAVAVAVHNRSKAFTLYIDGSIINPLLRGTD
jgi:hypothetical protein